MLQLSDLDYTLPEELIAQHPLAERDAARLLVVRRDRDTLEDRAFADLPALLTPGDLLVLNDTRVLPARLRAVKPDTGAQIEILLLEEVGPNEWTTLVRPGRRVAEGTRLRVAPEVAGVDAVVTAVGTGGERRIAFRCEASLRDLLDRLGEMPLPPYIKRPSPNPADRARYQTVFAAHPGAVAAPTAGLHFTPPLLEALARRGIQVTYLTLHVGLGTFLPLTDEHIAEGRLHEERYGVPAETAAALNAARTEGRRIVAVGTTVVRVLETLRAAAAEFRAGEGRTRLFLKPGDVFRAVDAMITNFHLPRSSLYALAAAFAGPDVLRRAYAHAIAERYRFYSYGDATLLC